MELEIQHFTHPEHPLILVDLRDTEIKGRIEIQKGIKREEMRCEFNHHELEEFKDDLVRCVLCRNTMLESSYSCISCDVHIHMLCAKLPTEMMHPKHIEHPLTLTRMPLKLLRSSMKKIRVEGPYSCDICHEENSGYSYCCRSCNFDVDVRCASESQEIDHEGHEHPLQPFLNTALFKCHACATEHSAGVSYKCSTCAFWVHEECAALPITIKYNRHVHLLSLAVEPLPVFRDTNMRCRICDVHMSKEPHWRWCYECEGCSHQVHVNCLVTLLHAERNRRYEVDDEIDLSKLFHLPESFQYAHLIGQMIKHMITHYYSEEMVVSRVDQPTLTHFSHEHPLTPTVWNAPNNNNNNINHKGKEMKDDERLTIICNACALPISTPQVYYSCSVSNNYFLHEWCAKLPNVLQHPTDPEITLTLGRDPRDKNDDVISDCRLCGCFTNGYIYRSGYDGFNYAFEMDIRCVCLPRAISHKSHKHPLKLLSDCYNQGCVACPHSRGLELAYGCKQCCFYLHFSCALQPIKVVHRYDKHHPFTLIDYRIEGGPDEYVCEFCEEHIDPQWWFYHCLPCDLSACVGCIFEGRSRMYYINTSVTYSAEFHHHPLSYVTLDRTNMASLCQLCKEYFNEKIPYWECETPTDRHALQCIQCKTMFHDRQCTMHNFRGYKLLPLQREPS